MKRALIGLLSAIFLWSGSAFPAAATPKSYNWYCKHVAGHVQPPIGEELAFVEELGAFYLDHRHSDANASDRVIYLTFDAGYENGNVEKILNVLHEEQAPAAFFILGNLITQNTALVKRMAEEGHTVCNHTVHHRDMSRASGEEFLRELKDLETLYRERTGYEMAKYYRPPRGTFSRENLLCAQENGYRTIFWSFAYADWDNEKQVSVESARQKILENVHNGEIMLLHPTSATNAALLGEVIRALRADGYRFASLDELCNGGAA